MSDQKKVLEADEKFARELYDREVANQARDIEFARNLQDMEIANGGNGGNGGIGGIGGLHRPRLRNYAQALALRQIIMEQMANNFYDLQSDSESSDSESSDSDDQNQDRGQGQFGGRFPFPLNMMQVVGAGFNAGGFNMGQNDNIQHIADELLAREEADEQNKPEKTPWDDATDPELEMSLVVSRLEVVTASPNPLDTCAICLGDADENIVKPPGCSHLFHLECIETHIQKLGATCPVCRSKI